MILYIFGTLNILHFLLSFSSYEAVYLIWSP
nr:MAG TPA: hypothetical protein [Caudoviricetes sp.]